MAGEEWARRIMQLELGCTVHLNDDGSASGMYDLRIGPSEAPEVAIECVGAVDPVFTETWNIGPGKGPLNFEIAGDWNVEITRNAKVNVVKSKLPLLLKELEYQGFYNLHVDHWLERIDQAMFEKLHVLGISHASCYRLPGSGKIYLGMQGTGGTVDEKGTAVSKWLGGFLRDSARLDVLTKLQRSGAPNRHAFVLVAFRGVPWEVECYLTGSLENVPGDSPDLPSIVTAAWIVSVFGHRGLHWDGYAWRGVTARGDCIDDKTLK